MRIDAINVAETRTLGGLILKFIARVVSDGRVTIPEQIRKLLGLKEGDFVSCDIETVNTPSSQPPSNQDAQATGERTDSGK